MSTWTQVFASQNFTSRLDEAVAKLESAGIDQLNQPQKDNFTRLLKVTKALRERLRVLDPDLLPRSQVDNAAGHLTNLRDNAVAFAQNRNFGHIDNANNAADALLNNFFAVSVGTPEVDVRVVADTANAFHQKIAEHLADVASKADQLRNEINGFRNQVGEGKAKLDENARTIDQQKGRLDKAIADFQQQFSQTEAKRAAEFTAMTGKSNEAVAAQQKGFEDAFKKQQQVQEQVFAGKLAAVAKESDEHLAFLKKRQREVDDIFGAIGSASMSGHFARTADAERTTANWLRIVAMVLMAGMILVAILAYRASLDRSDTDWRLFAFRLGTTIIIAVPAVYAAQESSKHRERERRLRSLQLELASIDAYLALLPTAKQQELKEKLTQHFFGREEQPEKTDDVSKHALFEVLKTTVNNLTKPK